MWMVAILVYAVIITVIAVSNKISVLAILLFCAEKIRCQRMSRYRNTH